MFSYSIEVRVNGRWHNWVYRNQLAKARLAKRNLNLTRNADWDKVRIRLGCPLFGYIG